MFRLVAVLYFFLLFFQETHSAETFGNFLTVDKSSVTFYLFNRKNLNDYIFLDTGEKLNIMLSADENSKQLFFLLHGWTESRNKTWYEDLKNALLEKFDANVIQIDYSKPAGNRYPIAVLLSKSVAKIIAKFILKIRNVDLKTTTIIGHSLGAQIAGYVGKEILTTINKKIGKIIALDPAGPLFSIKTPKNRLNSNDAGIVEVIHTDRNLGFYQNIGHVDFYVNAKRDVQPGCEDLDFIKAAFCGHHLSYKIFIASITNDDIKGTFCESELKYMEGDCDRNEQLSLSFERFSKPGAYYLETEQNFQEKLADFVEIEKFF